MLIDYYLSNNVSNYSCQPFEDQTKENNNIRFLLQMKKKLKEELKDKLDFNDEIQKDEKKPIVLKSKDKVKENFRSIFLRNCYDYST